MIKFNKPNKLNGSQLCQELIAAGIEINNPSDAVFVDEYNDLCIKIDKKFETKAKIVVDAHIGIDQTLIKAAQRQALLSRLGITEEEARILLGGN